MSDQEQFLEVIDRDEAELRFRSALQLKPLGVESVSVGNCLGRILAHNIIARVDVPAFDRSNFDGYAVRAADTIGASELTPKSISLLPSAIEAGTVPTDSIQPGQAIAIATGGMLPRGADAIVMVEHAEEVAGRLVVRRAATPGFGVSYAGSDIALGETVLRTGVVLTSRETGLLAAIGEITVKSYRQPRVTIISTGNEIIAPGEPMRPAAVYDSNSQVLADAVRELGAVPILAGIIRDDIEALRACLKQALLQSDLVILSGGTSKGQGDLCYRVVSEFNDPGIVVHGVALKPGKPICLAVTDGKPVVVLPGFPTSAIFTFHEFVAPVIRSLAGRFKSNSIATAGQTLSASLAVRVNSEIGRTEFLLVGLVESDGGLAAFPMGKGSGSVTTFSRADGFVTIPRHTEMLDIGTSVEVRLLGRDLELADLIVIGSHCIGLDLLLTKLQQQGFQTKLLTVGSSAGLMAAKRGECDLAGIHLLDEISGTYNRHCLDESVKLLAGYRRSQGIVFRADDSRFLGKTVDEILALAKLDPQIVMVGRNQGSGTRFLIDRLLAGHKIAGSPMQPNNHSAVAAAIVQHRADWGVAISATARAAQLAFVPLQDEQFDFVVPTKRLQRPAVQAFIALLENPEVRRELSSLGIFGDVTTAIE